LGPFLTRPDFDDGIALEVVGITTDANSVLIGTEDFDMGIEPRLAVVAEVGLENKIVHSHILLYFRKVVHHIEGVEEDGGVMVFKDGDISKLGIGRE
jgi:hypothetical protein